VPDLPAGVLKLYLPKNRAADQVRKVDSDLAKFAKQQLKNQVAHRYVSQGIICRVILESAEMIGADLIVMGFHSPAMKGFLLGPNAAHVLRQAD